MARGVGALSTNVESARGGLKPGRVRTGYDSGDTLQSSSPRKRSTKLGISHQGDPATRHAGGARPAQTTLSMDPLLKVPFRNERGNLIAPANLLRIADRQIVSEFTLSRFRPLIERRGWVDVL